MTAVAAGVTASGTASGTAPGTASPTASAATELNAALARRWFEEGWNRGNLEVAPEIFAPGFVLGGEQVGPAGPQRSVSYIRKAFHPLTVVVEFQVAEGPMVVTRYRAEGVHAGEYRGLAPTGRRIVAHGVQIWRVEDGLAVQDWNTFDEWGLVAQLGSVELRPSGVAA